MKKFTKMLMVVIVATTSTTYAQYAGDAVRFSNTNYGSSSRFKGMGGAQIGVGGDISSLGGNPAGLGLFTKSEFSFTPGFSSAGSKSTYLGQKNNTSQDKMNLDQIGVVWYSPSYRAKGQDLDNGVISTVFGIGYNRNSDFNQHYSYGGTNNSNSLRNFIAEEANRNMDGNGIIGAGTLEDMAFNGFLLDFNAPGNANIYSTTPVSNSMNAVQSKTETITGSNSELNFSAAINISNQFYLGASIGIVNLRYISDSEFTEKGTINPYDPDQGRLGNESYTLSYRQNQETKGTGVNGRLGLIFRPVDNFRIGATLQTPTWMYIEDTYSEVLDNTNTNAAGQVFRNNNNPDNYPYAYRLKTPLKGSLGASYVIGGQAIISADIDYIDYSTVRFSTDEGPEDGVVRSNNSDIRKLYTSTVNYRVGGEYKIDKFSVRAGYGLNGSPLKGDDDNIFQRQFYSGGLGYRINQYYVDLAYQRSESENTVSPYYLNNASEPSASIKNANNNVFLTFGIRF